MKDNKYCKDCKGMHMHHGGASGAVYGFGVIGAAVYYIQHAQTLQAGLIGLGKAIIWPALLVYKLIEVLKF